MYNNCLLKTYASMIVGLLQAVCWVAFAETETNKTYDSYPEWELLPRGIDLEDETLRENYHRLVDQGESAYEAMLAVVLECDELMPATAALAVLTESKGDKRAVMEKLRRFLAERLPNANENEEWLCTAIAKALAKNGSEADAKALIPMLSHSNKRVRLLGARYLGQCGDRSSLNVLENAKKQTLSSRELFEIESAITNIQNRLADSSSGENGENGL